MTYNHADYIREAMEGILMQKTNFFVEVVVGDDFSTDDTLKIIKEYKNTENIHIKILERKVGDAYWKKRQELGRLYNFTNILDNCTGNYIALLDGDDYWTDPLKLQKQVDFLDANEEYSLCFTSRNIYKEATKEYTFEILKNQTFTTENILKGMIAFTQTIVFRNSTQMASSWQSGAWEALAMGNFRPPPAW